MSHLKNEMEQMTERISVHYLYLSNRHRRRRTVNTPDRFSLAFVKRYCVMRNRVSNACVDSVRQQY